MVDPTPTQKTITEVLRSVQRGDAPPCMRSFRSYTPELHTLASAQRCRWHGDLPMNATALVHEAYLKLVDQTGLVAESCGHFLAVAAKAMRHILCNYAHDRQRLKRGGGAQHVTIDDALDAVSPDVWEEQAEQLPVSYGSWRHEPTRASPHNSILTLPIRPGDCTSRVR